jgi:beta-glucosidase
MGWGSGTANFPYLIDPAAALNTYIQANKPTTMVESIFSDFNYGAVTTSASNADVCLVFANADSGEGYITVDGNAGDRNNLTLWHGADTLITTTASVCSNTIVILHTVGPVLVEAWINNPNVTAVLSAHLPGQETGNAIVDILFGAVNPSGRLPYTMAKQRSDYPADVVYTSTQTSPQITYSEGLEIDYRHFDANNIQPRFEFGFGLSYTTFSYSELSIRSSNTRREVDSDKKQSSAVASSTAVLSSVFASSTKVKSTKTKSVASTVSASIGSSSVIVTSTFRSLNPPPPASSVFSGSAITSRPVSSLSSVASTATSRPGSGSASGSVASSVSRSMSGSGSASASRSMSASGSVSANATSTVSSAPAYSSPAQTHPGGPSSLYSTFYEVSFVVTNSGGVDGYEVSQVYVTFPEGSGEPPKVLRGFERTFIGAGASVSVDIALRKKDLSVWDVVKQKWVVPSGAFTISVGSSSRLIHLTSEINI